MIMAGIGSNKGSCATSSVADVATTDGRWISNVAPAPRPATVRLDRAAVQLDQLLGDGEAQTESAVFARDRPVSLAERLEDAAAGTPGRSRCPSRAPTTRYPRSRSSRTLT